MSLAPATSRTLPWVALAVMAALLLTLAPAALTSAAQAADRPASAVAKPTSKQKKRCARKSGKAKKRCLRMAAKRMASATNARSAVLPSQKIYWGARADGDVYGRGDAPWDLTTWNLFEQHAGKKVSILHFGQPPPWRLPFDRNPFNLVSGRGAIPYVSMSSDSVSLTSIANGSYDSYLIAWARAAKAYGKPFLLRWNWEMNGTWFSWGAQAKTNPAAYVASWRRFHNIVKAEGATNVTWVWCPCAVWSASTPLTSLYPGDAYVDWTCVDVYNFGRIPLKNDVWKSFYTVMKPTYDQLMSLAPTKPILIGETASTEWGGSKSAWITDALKTQIPVTFPKIRGVAWFNWNIFANGGRYDWQIESSASAQSAFASGISLPNYVTNNYGSLPWLSKVVPPA